MKASTLNLSGTIRLSVCIAATLLGALNLRAQTGPPCIDTNAVKFLMPPQVNGGLDVRDCRPLNSGQLPGTSSNILADDFFCNTTGPIIGIHIWGSWLNDNHGTITNFWLGIYNDVPTTTNQFGKLVPSHPGTVQLWQQSFGFGQYSESIYTNGSEQFMDPTGQPRIIGADSTVWYYCFNPATPFVQQGTTTQPTNYWLLVRADIADNTTVFGWKSSSSNYNDVAVWGNVDLTTGNPLGDWQGPMTNPITLTPINLSFKIDTGTNNQPPPPVPCIETNGVKFRQLPQIDGGLDVRDSGGDIVLADDFFCHTTGPITDIHLWGSWLNDVQGTITNFWIGIYSDVPAVTNPASGQVTPSHPGQNLLWQQNFGPGQFAQNPAGLGSEQFLDPVGGAFLGPDTEAWYFCFYPTNPFVQQGTAANPTNYWLAVYASVDNQAGPPGLYGWKTARANYNDPAVWGNITATGVPVGNWQSMTNPQTRSPIGLSFLLTTPTNPPPPPVCDERDGAKYTQLPNFQGLDVWNNGPWVLADDFVCTNTGPVSDIHLWGSWAKDVQPDTNTTFWLAIYDNVPASATNNFSYPGTLLWNEVFPPGQYIQSFYGTGTEQFLDPGPPNILGPESNIWYYCFYPTNIFTQRGTAAAPKIYWLMVYAQTPAGSGNLYGWKTTTVVSNDISVHAQWPGSPPTVNPGWKPTLQASTGGPLDLAFKITTATTPPCLNLTCPPDITMFAPCGSSCALLTNVPPFFATNYCDPSDLTVTFNPPLATYCFPANGIPTPVTVTVSGSGQSLSCTFNVTVVNNPNCPPTNNPPCLSFDCPTNMYLYAPCGSSCVIVSNYPPIFATNFCNPLAGPTITFNPPPGTYCFPANGVATPVTVTVSGSGETSNCTFSVTVSPNPNCPPTNNPPCLDFECPTNMVLYAPCGSNCVIVSNYPPVFATNLCTPGGVTVTFNPPPGTCFPAISTTPVTVTISGSGETSNCTFSVTVLPNQNCPPPVSCNDTNTVKYLQPPQPINGFDVWNSSAFPPNATDGPWVLADDFICTNTGPITDIHLWGSWLNNQAATNSITFWIALFDDVPGGPAAPSHPGNFLWSQCFSPGQYAETFYGPSDETFIDPGASVTLGPDTQIWYYCFYPTNPPIQLGTTSNPKVYWLAVFAQQPAGTAGSYFGWKTTTNLQHDVSVHALWQQGFCPTNIAGTGLAWTPNISPQGVPVDLSFMLTTHTNPCTGPTIYCTNMVVECGTSWTPIAPGVSDPCCTPPPSPVLVSSVTNTTTVCPTYVTNIWKVTDCQNLTATCEQTITIQDTTPPFFTLCPTNFTVPCGTSWNFGTPIAQDACCLQGVSVLSTVTNNPGCPLVVTRTWVAQDCCGLTNTCTQTVTVQDTNGPVITCATNKTVINGSAWTFDPPTAIDPCAGTTLPVTVVSTTTNGTSPCSEIFIRTWQAVDGCNKTNFCSQTVTNRCLPVACVESDKEKYVQAPNIFGGFDVWNTPDVLADDFICTNRGPISDIHLWGSWLSDQSLTNSITFWLGIYDDVPAATNGTIITPSHPGTNLMWQQWFAPGQYAETIWTANAQEQFLDPGASNVIGSDSVVWYYCFYPTNAFEQLGTPTNHITYWLAAYAQLPLGIAQHYGWKTTTNVLHDTSVHAPWPGVPPIGNPGWTPTAERPATGGPAVPLDLSFKITSCGPVTVYNLAPTNVIVFWEGGGHLQWASNVIGPYSDVPGSPTSPFTDYSVSPTNKFYRLRCYP